MTLADPPVGGATPVIPVPEIRDHRRINAEIGRLLDYGHRRVVLDGVESQRLLLYGLSGGWVATIEVRGLAGPEFAAELDAPGLTVLGLGGAGVGAGRGLRAGTLCLVGPVGDLVGNDMRGGRIVVVGPSGHRAGLRMAGGFLTLCGPTGRLLGERQSGGVIALQDLSREGHAGHARSGGRLLIHGAEMGRSVE